MMSAPSVAAPSPFRSPGGGAGGSLLRTSPWPPTAHAPEGFGRFAVGGSVYSLFPSVPSATEASAIYSQSSGSPGARFGTGHSTATTFHSFLSTPQKGDTLFSAGFPLTPTSIPPSSPQTIFSAAAAGLSPLEAERGISQLELMARGFPALPPQMQQPPPIRRVEEERRVETKRAARGGRERGSRQSRADKKAKEDAIRVSCCSCPVSKATCTVTSVSAAHPVNPITTSTSHGLAFSSSSPPFHCSIDAMGAASLTAFHPPANIAPIYPTMSGADTLSGCSRTNPVPPRSRSSDSRGAEAFSPVVIKKEAGTPCQVDEVTTSIRKERRNHHVQAIKAEPAEDLAKHARLQSSPSTSAASTVSSIPVGIAVARQRSSSPGRATEEASKVKHQEKQREDYRVLLPARRTAPAPLAPAPITTSTVINSMAQATATSAPTALMVHPQERTATLMTSSIVLQPPPATTAAAAAATLQVHTGGEDAVTQALAAARLSSGLPPWASHSAPNSALTPPTLWLGQPQYPAGPTVQIEAAPPPPVGLQLVRDPMTGHLILLPTSSLDHMQRTLQVWPSNTTTTTTTFPHQAQNSLPQLMLPQNTNATTQHITVFPQQNETEFRILLPPQHLTQQTQPQAQLALVQHEPVKQSPCKKDPMETKIELMHDPMTAKLMPADAQFPTSFVFPAQSAGQPQQAQQQQPATQVQYFYEQITGTTVQISPQPLPPSPSSATSSAVTPAPPVLVLDPGRRSQATSPSNPAESCLTPPPETASPPVCPNEGASTVSTSSESGSSAEDSNQESAVGSSSPEVEATSEAAPVPEVKCQDASNQTETPPVSEDEGSRDASVAEEVSEDGKESEPEMEIEPVEAFTPEPEPIVQQPMPVDVSGLELLSNSIEQFVEREKEAEKQSMVLPQQQQHMIGGLGLLCALAEQRFFEDIECKSKEEEEEKVEVKRVEEPEMVVVFNVPEKIDVNRNYKSPKSEKKIKKFIASKVSQYAENGGTVQPTCADGQNTEYIDGMELNLRMRLAELQKQYKAKQKELSKLQNPRRNSIVSDDSNGSPNKRGPGRPRKRKLSPAPSPKKPKIPKEQEKVVEKEVAAAAAAVLVKSKSKDILKPPTLNTNKILTSPKFKPSLSDKFRTKSDQEKSPKDDEISSSSDGSSPGSSWLSGGFNSFRKSSEPTQIKSSPTAFTFGSKISTSLMPGGEKQRFQPLATDSFFWFSKPDKENTSSLSKTGTHQFGELPSNGFKKNPMSSSEPESDQESGSPTLFQPNPTSGAGGSSSSSSCSSCSSSSSKKRKPGRPKRRTPGKPDQTNTETIVAKKRSISFLLNATPSFNASSTPENRPKIKPKLKAEIKLKTTCDDEDESWTQKSESAFTPAEPAGAPWTSKPTAAVERERPRTMDAAQRLGTKKRPSVSGSSKSPVAKQRSNSAEIKAKRACTEVGKGQPKTARKQMPSSTSDRQMKRNSIDFCSSINGNLMSCTLMPEDLEGEPRALRVMGGLAYAGQVTAIRAPDLYGITLDGERGNRPHILSREEALKELIREVKPQRVDQVLPGTRICAYWSQQSRCLYPGTVAEPTTPNAELDANSVNVEFDDGDSGRIVLEDIRMLPGNFPVVEYDPNPLLSLAKRRRRASGASSTEGRRTSSEAPLIVPEQRAKSPSPAPVAVESSKKSADSTPSNGSTKHLSDEERERKKQKKKDKAKKKERLRKLLPESVLKNKISSHKKHKKHHHKHHHHKKRHRHRKHGEKESSCSVSSEPSTPEVLVPEVREPSPVPAPVVVPEVQEVEEVTPVVDKKTKQTSPKKRQERQSSGETKSKMAAFLPARQLWKWSGKGYKRPGGKGRGKKEFFKSIQRGKETINVGDCAVFLSTGRPDRPYIGRIETMWESWGGNMVVRVKWFYHPEETQGGGNLDKLKYPGALFQSPHADENDVQTISHKCEVIPLADYTRRLGKEPSRYATIYDNNDIYYLAGHYDPTAGVLTMEPGVI